MALPISQQIPFLPTAPHIRYVWSHNVEEEIALIKHFAQYFPFASIDTEFPGVVYEASMHPRYMAPQERYSLMKKNVDCLKLIQLGLTLSNPDGCASITWEINFCGFNPLQDPHAPSSINLLQSQGINLWENYYYGVDPRWFAHLMKSSGLLFNPLITWVGFHLAYDMGYLVKILTGADLPDSMDTFLWLVQSHFGPRIFDIKHMCKCCINGLEGGLEKIAGVLNVQRAVGTASHHAGSDSLLIFDTRKRLIACLSNVGVMPAGPIAGVLFGIQNI